MDMLTPTEQAQQDETTRHIESLRASQKHNKAEVADGLIGVADGLEKLAKRLRSQAKQVRAGGYLPDFARSSGRDARWDVQRLVDQELPKVDGEY